MGELKIRLARKSVFIFCQKGALLPRYRVQRVWISRTLLGDETRMSNVSNNDSRFHHYGILASIVSRATCSTYSQSRGLSKWDVPRRKCPPSTKMVLGNASLLFGNVQLALSNEVSPFDLGYSTRAVGNYLCRQSGARRHPLC